MIVRYLNEKGKRFPKIDYLPKGNQNQFQALIYCDWTKKSIASIVEGEAPDSIWQQKYIVIDESKEILYESDLLTNCQVFNVEDFNEDGLFDICIKEFEERGITVCEPRTDEWTYTLAGITLTAGVGMVGMFFYNYYSDIYQIEGR